MRRIVRFATSSDTWTPSPMTRLGRLAPLLVLFGLAACDRARPVPTKREKAAAALQQAIDRGNVEAEAGRMFNAMYRWGDVDTLIEHCHPRLLQATGGEPGTRAAFEKLVGEVQSSGLRIESFVVLGSTTLLSTDFSDFALVPTRSVFRVGDSGRIASWSYLFAARKKGETDWGYVDGSRLNEDNLWVLFPDFPKNVELPRCAESQLE
jgi:hypothetical protein